MSVLDKILCYKPQNWETTSYDNAHYKSFTVDSKSVEYIEVMMDIELTNVHSIKITKIERIQHPYAYFRYLIRKKQIIDMGFSVREKRHLLYFKADSTKSNIIDVINCNGDIRRNSETSINYSTPDHMLVMQKLQHHLSCKDSDCYPEYLLEISC